MVTSINSYDHTAGYSSNSLSRYFHELGQSDQLNELVKSKWLGIDQLSLGGPYGELAPDSLQNVMESATSGLVSELERYPCGTMSNSLSPLASAEMTRRLVQHEIVDEQFRWPGLSTVDHQTILYGAEETLLFDDQKWGGMTSDPGIYLQHALDMNLVNLDIEESDWRIFSKLGGGYSGYRFVGEVTSNVS